MLDHILDSIGELRNVDEAGVCVISDLSYLVVEKLSHNRQNSAVNQCHSSLLRVRNLQDGTGSEFSKSVFRLAAALDELNQDLGVKGFVQLISLMEVLVDLNQNFHSQFIVICLHLSGHFLYKQDNTKH